MIDPNEWQVMVFQSGSTVITNSDVVLYVHDYAAITGAGTSMTDSELDDKKLRYAKWIAAVLNEAGEVPPDVAH